MLEKWAWAHSKEHSMQMSKPIYLFEIDQKMTIQHSFKLLEKLIYVRADTLIFYGLYFLDC